MVFGDIIGNERIKNILVKALRRRRLPHSLLFCGPEGVGKKDMAEALAQALVCEKKNGDACGLCDSCRRAARGVHPDIIKIFPENDVIVINKMRMIKETAYFKPMLGDKRIFIITNADKMNDEAANSLLKILEEPPLFTHVILVTDNSFVLKPTIKSRCQILNFSPVSREDIVRILTKKGFDEKKANIMSLMVRGNLKQALNLDWDEVAEEKEKCWELFVALLKRENLFLFLEEYTAGKKSEIQEEICRMMEIFSLFCRDFILVKEGGPSALLINPEYKDRLKEHEERWTLNQALECLDKIDYTLSGMRRHQNFRLLMSSFTAHFAEQENV
ncbi:MAG: DNA polymerase III subunit delta' [Candidatus Aminicenantes bacterium]|nr:DNA polymerase III subunit delta' [Candidatus Aminicenantes bacterium]